MPNEMDPDRWGRAKIEIPARRIIDAGLGEGRSLLEPAIPAWNTDTVVDLRTRVIDNANTGRGAFLDKLRRQLSEAPRAVSLLAVELLALHVLPLGNVKGKTKLRRVSTVLSWIDPPARLPDDLRDALDGPGIFNGGVGFNVQIWQQLGWLLAFIEEWNTLPPADRKAALDDPWKFRAFVQEQETGQMGIRNSLLYLAFPRVFLPIASQPDKKRIRDTFAEAESGEPTGDDGISVDRDLRAIYDRQSRQVDKVIHYYRDPWRAQWSKSKPAPSSERAWLVRDPATDRTVIGEGHVSIVAEHLGDFEPDMDREALTAAVNTGYTHLDYAQRLTLANTFHQFTSTMRADDLVAAVIGDELYAGVIAADAELAEDEVPRLRRAVNWTQTPLGSLGDLPPKLRAELDQRGTIADITAAAKHLKSLMSPAEAPEDLEPTTPGGLLPPTQALADDLHYDLPWLDKLVTVLEDRKQIVLHGPPGTGKTYLARAIARHLTGRDAIRLVQFHPSYTYEDFFEGFRPALKGGTATFDLVPGPLRRLAAEAEADKGRPHVLIIDEINRANLAKVFGELYFLLEYRDEKIDLQYSRDEAFKLPDNIYLIGTMNTADRSIAQVDAAMRRRFAFVELHPDETPVHGLLDRWAKANHKTDDRAALLDKLNAAIATTERDFKIGPSYLMKPEADRDGGLDLVWEHSILPLLEQHYHHLGRAEVHTRFGLKTLRSS